MGAKNKYFSRIEDEALALALVIRMASGLSNVIIWTKDQKALVRTKLSGYRESKELICVVIPKGMRRNEVMTLLKELRSEEVFFA